MAAIKKGLKPESKADPKPPKGKAKKKVPEQTTPKHGTLSVMPLAPGTVRAARVVYSIQKRSAEIAEVCVLGVVLYPDGGGDFLVLEQESSDATAIPHPQSWAGIIARDEDCDDAECTIGHVATPGDRFQASVDMMSAKLQQAADAPPAA